MTTRQKLYIRLEETFQEGAVCQYPFGHSKSRPTFSYCRLDGRCASPSAYFHRAGVGDKEGSDENVAEDAGLRYGKIRHQYTGRW